MEYKKISDEIVEVSETKKTQINIASIIANREAIEKKIQQLQECLNEIDLQIGDFKKIGVEFTKQEVSEK